ncbi:MAG TPA: hypothetical protein PKY59_22810 [Pyrinomonadaceae bacterium]|nr:hypothetical protein [Pyrinomonadaceae bacterium]
MESDVLMQKLHEKSVKGNALNDSEKNELDSWYAEQDRLESEILSQKFVSEEFNIQNEAFQKTLEEISESKKRIAEISRQNENLSNENEILRRKLHDRESLKVA